MDVFFTESYKSPKVTVILKELKTSVDANYPQKTGSQRSRYLGRIQPENFRKMSIGMAEMGFKGVDINMGCPVPNVASRGKGSGLILRPDVASELIEAAKAGGLPVSVKTRLGYSHVDEWKDWLTHILKQDIANLSIHLRTRKEMSQVPAHWELIPEIKTLRDEIAPNTLLTINGDIPDRQTGLELAEKYGIDGVMIGRGIS